MFRWNVTHTHTPHPRASCAWCVLCYGTCVVGGTEAGVVIDSIDACGSVLTVIVFTVVSVCLASRALKAQWTGTTEKIHTHIYMYVYICVCVSMHIYIYVCMYVCTQVRMKQNKASLISSVCGLHRSSSSPVCSLIILSDLACSSIGTRVTHTSIQSCLAVLALHCSRTKNRQCLPSCRYLNVHHWTGKMHR